MPSGDQSRAADRRAPVNPRTGKPWSLADKEIRTELSDELKQMRGKPALAEQFLKDLGVLTPTGKLSKRYGG